MSSDYIKKEKFCMFFETREKAQAALPRFLALQDVEVVQGEDYCLVRPVGIETTSESLRQLYTLRAGDEAIVSANDLYDGKVVE